ncbi:SCP2 sterol-binding domain-containing protein [Rhodococcus opacus]|uniref:Sterol transfer protein n=2 Tax=Rhodococcus TaxID=1827 RepID=A0A076F0G9_RHOOP|nr:SCP2 sterol-binding domain-containing protein [Rhodococcus opacus]ACL31218.1 putative sterol transfer protein [Rhodococcus sp. TFB]AII11491.1 sterol transfer protein [Rhodococcus opacus]
MTKKLLSEDWIKEYGELWNQAPETTGGTADLTITIIYRLAEDPDSRRAQLDIKEGIVVYAGAVQDDKTPDFVLTAKLDVWRQFADGKLRAQRALMMKKLKFDGPLMVALSHIPGLEAALGLFGRVTDTEWS